jgi:hypothetical protein
MQTMSLSRLSLKQSKGVISQLRASHDNRKIYDEWDNPTMPKWARELYDDPKCNLFLFMRYFDILLLFILVIDEARKLPQETDWKKKALWRRFAWNRDFEKYIPQGIYRHLSSKRKMRL